MHANIPPASTLLSPSLDDRTFLSLTKEGERELKEPGTTLAPAYLEALVLLDGQSTITQVLKRAISVAPNVLRENLIALIDRGLVSAHSDPEGLSFDAGDFFTLDTPPSNTSGLGEQHNAEAGSNTEFLRRNGYYVNMAHRPAIKRHRDKEHKLVALVIDDDEDIGKLLRFYLKLENIDTRTAMNRDEIVAEFHRAQLPDLVLLDVQLKDVNGFNVLAKMREHPVLKKLPVIMLTASATREAVLKGVMGGADGYITKPFLVQPLIRAVKTVLGLKVDDSGSDWDYSL